MLFYILAFLTNNVYTGDCLFPPEFRDISQSNLQHSFVFTHFISLHFYVLFIFICRSHTTGATISQFVIYLFISSVKQISLVPHFPPNHSPNYSPCTGWPFSVYKAAGKILEKVGVWARINTFQRIKRWWSERRRSMGNERDTISGNRVV